jgi:hypothetical protein
MTDWTTARVHGQESFLLRTRSVELAVTATGGVLGPVTFFPDGPAPIRPYAIAPWAEEALSPDTPPTIAALRGDWFCSAFGENAGRKLPPHGETANRLWRGIAEAGRRRIVGCGSVWSFRCRTEAVRRPRRS